MTVENEISKVVYLADGVQTEFAYTFRLDAASDMQVFFDEVEQIGGFTVFLASDVGGPRVVFDPDPPAFEVSVTLIRVLELDQQADYVPFDKFPAESHEQALDKLTMLVQQLQEELSRTTQIGQGGDPTVDYTLPPYDVGKGWMWSEDEPKRIVNSDDTLNGILALVTAQADAAAASASAAATSEGNASGSASAAAGSAAAASTSEGNAAFSETNASASAAAAALSESNAAGSESGAGSSATDAANSAAAALISEGNASVSEGNAATSAAAAAVSASDASNSEAAAASSASGAAISESNALSSATAAQQSADDALAAANAAMGWDISIVHNGALADDAITRVMVSRGLKWVLGGVASGFMEVAPSAQVIIPFQRFNSGGTMTGQIGTLTFGAGVNVGTWAEEAGSDIPFAPGEMAGVTFPAAMNGAEGFSSVLPLTIDITVLATPPGQFDLILPETNILNYNVRAAINALGYPGNIPATITILAQPGTVIGSASYGMASFSTGTFFAGSTIVLTNNGKIQGAGGFGGAGAPQGGAPGAGQDGDQAGAVMLDWDLSIDNTNGAIWAGGGGGGGGGSTNTQFETGAGGGGGQGIPGGAGGPQGAFGGGGNGQGGTPFQGGTGGLPFEAPDRGRGGDGGGSGLPGEAGYDSAGGAGGGGAAGIGGRAINLQGNTYTDLGTGDIQGPVS